MVVPIRAQGPLEPFREGFRQKLETENWSPSATESKLCLFSDLSRWLRGRGLSAADLTGDVVEEYFVSHRRPVLVVSDGTFAAAIVGLSSLRRCRSPRGA